MTSWKPDLLSLRLFVAVCEESSIAKAAERESIVPSAVSKRIAEIEDGVGVRLLVRGSRGVRPTAAGGAFLHHARQILQGTERMLAELGQYAKGVRGHVRLFANISSIAESLPRDLSRFLANHPGIRLDMQERVSPLIVSGVREGAADVGVCVAPPDTAGVQLLAYDKDEMALVVHPDHPLAGRNSACLEDTLDHEFVALNPESGTTRLLAMLAARAGKQLNHRIYVSTFEAACHVIAENLAIGILVLDAVRPLIKALRLKVIPLTDAWARRDIVMCVRDYDGLAPPARSLVDHLSACGEQRRKGR